MSAPGPAPGPAAGGDYVTVRVGGQWLGLPIGLVQEVFVAGPIAPVPLAPPAIAGLLNVRGRVLTVLCLRRRLGLPPRRAEEEAPMVAHVEQGGEAYGLLVDAVGGVVAAAAATFAPNPANLDPVWARLSRGVHRLDDGLIIVVDLDAALSLDAPADPPPLRRACP